MANRIDGIISGMDTESLVKAMVSHQQNQIDRLNQKNQLLTWQRTKYTEIYKKIETFRNNSLYNYKLDATTKLKTATSTNESLVTAKTTADAINGTHTITVHQLASGAQTGSQSAMGSTSDKSSISKQFVDGNGDALYTNPFTIKLNGKEITVDPTKSMNDLAKQINESGAGVKATYDANTDRLFISAEGTGSDAKVDFTATDDATGLSFLKDTLKMPVDNNGDLVAVTGKDAIIDIDGVNGITQSSNEFTIAGINYSLKEADPTKTTTIEVKSDTEAILQSVKDFVNSYNELLESINSVLYEQKYSGFTPLTDLQKESMTADQITSWEDKAQSGILRTDSLLMSITSSMRSNVYSTVNGISSVMVDGRKVTYNSMYSIGITTGNYSDNGKLEIDEDKLRAAIEADPDAVNKIMNGGAGADGKRTDGIADKLYDEMKKGLDKIDAKAGSAKGESDITSNLAKKIKANADAIDKKTTRMNLQMQTYYKQFDAMETLLQQMQSQQDSLANYFSS